ncbi:MAG: hypothetical protein AAFV93_22650, partial [Chloroflexota bacterium]
MLMQLTDLFEVRSRKSVGNRPVSSLAFDWLYTGLLLLFTVGFMMDVWSHSTFGPDQSVLSEYHLLFYTSGALMGALLVGSHFRNVGAGYRFEDALPQGYGFALLALLGFGVAGAADLVGHALWGFEVDNEALLSPSHLGLFVTWGGLASGTVMATLARVRRHGKQSLLRMLPAIIGLVAMLLPFSVMMLISSLPMGDFTIVQAARIEINHWLLESHALVGFYIQTALLFGFLLWFIRNMPMPLGAITLIFALYGFIFGLVSGDSVLLGTVASLSGFATELVYHAVRPHGSRRINFRLFGFLAPIAFWLAYFGYIMVTNFGGGIGMTEYMW